MKDTAALEHFRGQVLVGMKDTAALEHGDEKAKTMRNMCQKLHYEILLTRSTCARVCIEHL